MLFFKVVKLSMSVVMRIGNKIFALYHFDRKQIFHRMHFLKFYGLPFSSASAYFNSPEVRRAHAQPLQSYEQK